VSEPRFEVSDFAVAFQRFVNDIGELIPDPPDELRDRMVGHLGTDPAGLPSITEQLSPSDHANLQLALNQLMAEDPRWDLVGLSGELRNWSGFSLVSLASGRIHGGQARPTAIEYTNMPISSAETLPCIQMALGLGFHDDEPLLFIIAAAMDHGPRAGLSVEVLARDQDTGERFIARLRVLMHEKNVYRGKTLTFSTNEYGRAGLNFLDLPAVGRSDVILPETDLVALERHTIGIAARAAALRAGGRHLKRGLLLYGPPGTGKTLSVMYLCNEMSDRTTVILAGGAGGALGFAVALGRSLQPSMVVLEDVDLIAMERTMSLGGTNALLYQLLNEMDGLAADSDVIFVLTTNRADLLEPALASRPGRIDQAIEFQLPDASARHRLFELYLEGLPHEVGDLETLVAGTEGVSPAFIKELIRRAAVEAPLDEASGAPRLSAAALNVALTDLLVHSAPLTRALLGAERA
jgi:hypothetical protein